MAFYDWNGDGKKDWVDNYIEYNIYMNCKRNQEKKNKEDHSFPGHPNYFNTSSRSNHYKKPASGSSFGRGISTFGAIVATIGGLFLAAAIWVFFGGGEDVSETIAIILWLICTGVLFWWFDRIGF